MRGLLALAFGAGMLSPVNPCGFALLPAYLGYYLGASDRRAAAGLGVRLAQGLRAGVVLTLGFAGTLSVLGLAVTAGARPLLGAAPWLGLVVGAALAVLGAFMLTGRTLPLRLPPPAHPTVTAPTSTPRLAAFGAAYALASLACTVGVLLAVIGQALAAASLAGVLVVFAAYTAGAATLLVLLSVSVALAGGLLIGRIRALLPIASRLAGAVLGLAGVYLVLYWAPVTQARGPGTLLGVGLQPLAARVATWVAAHQTATALLAVAVTLAALTAAASSRRRRPASSPGRGPGPGDWSTGDQQQPDTQDASRPAEPSRLGAELGADRTTRP